MKHKKLRKTKTLIFSQIRSRQASVHVPYAHFLQWSCDVRAEITPRAHSVRRTSPKSRQRVRRNQLCVLPGHCNLQTGSSEESADYALFQGIFESTDGWVWGNQNKKKKKKKFSFHFFNFFFEFLDFLKSFLIFKIRKTIINERVCWKKKIFFSNFTTIKNFKNIFRKLKT